MAKTSSNDIREAFLKYFEDKGHTRVASSSLIPANDKTLLFTNAGMNQFKDVFLGKETKPYTRATSSQRCVRAGGKHNDLENVGYTARHHTFFEMLGNFSFGDYFKKEAIEYAWEFLTEVLKLPKEKLWVTVFEKDDEAADIWLKDIGVDPNRFGRIGEKDNFWSMGDTGPCGPCSEIFYDHGEDIPGGPPGSADEDGDRYIEIWNLVFMQYNRDADGQLHPLPKPSVDTGMGLERLAAILQNGHSNYDIDLFQNLIKAAAKATNTKDLEHKSLRVIADHIRSCAFIIVDGVVPSNEGQGSVLRRIIRRAARHGYMLGQNTPFFHTLVEPLCQEMGAAYPELKQKKDHVIKTLRREEERFGETLERGMKLLDEYTKKDMKNNQVDGEFAFTLYDTYGFPIDLTADIGRESGFSVDQAGFDAAMQRQKESGPKDRFDVDYNAGISLDCATSFTGYDHTDDSSKVVALFKGKDETSELKENDEGIIVLEHTPFYAESGGQVGDIGSIEVGNAVFEVKDTQKNGNAFVHIGRMAKGAIKLDKNTKVTAKVDAAKRNATALNHSATHLMHAALREVLGDHVTQKGSVVDPQRLRFDFSHPDIVSADELAQIERLVNEQIRMNNEVQTNVMSYDNAVKAGAMALFGEKYGDEVRVLKMGDFSTELCGGTHANRTGDIGLFKIVSETGTASGIRRIEAVTGERAIEYIARMDSELQQIAGMLKAGRDKTGEKVNQLLERNKSLEKELEQLKGKLASSQGSDLAQSAVDIKGVKVLAAQLDGADPKSLRDTVDQLKNKLGSAAVVLATVSNGKVSLVAGVTKDQIGKIKAGELVNFVATQVGGKGGGRPDMAMAGGTDPDALPAAIQSVSEWISEQLS